MTPTLRATAFSLGLTYGTAIAERMSSAERAIVCQTGLSPPSGLAGTRLAADWVAGTRLAARVLNGLV